MILYLLSFAVAQMSEEDAEGWMLDESDEDLCLLADGGYFFHLAVFMLTVIVILGLNCD